MSKKKSTWATGKMLNLDEIQGAIYSHFLSVPNRLTRGPEMDGMTWETELAMKKQR